MRPDHERTPAPATRTHRRRARGRRRAAGPRAHRARARDVRGDVVRALLLQVVEASTSAGSPPRRPGCSSARVRARASSTSATASRSPSASRATTTRPRSSRTRARRRASAASSATSSRWVRARSRSWTRCASVRSTTPARATCSRASSPASAATATRSACRPSAARSCSTTATASNPLVNVLCLGVLPVERLVLAKAEGVGNLAVLLGSATGRDGIGGASVLASAGFSEGDEAKRPSVQVGDPYEEKRLIEACLELLDAGLAIGVQDLGAAGISCAASETAAKTGAGMDVDLARDAQARAGHERRRGDDVGEPGAHARHRHAREPRRRCSSCAARWEIRASVIGRVTDTARFRVYDGLFDAVGVPGAQPAGAARRRPAGACRPTRSPSPTCPSPAWATARSTTARSPRPPTSRTRARRRSRARAGRAVPRRHRPRPPSCWRCSRRRPSPTSRGCTASTTTSCSSTPWSRPAATRRCCG